MEPGGLLAFRMSLVLGFEVALAIGFVTSIGIGTIVWSRRELSGTTAITVIAFGTAAWLGGDLGFYATAGSWMRLWALIRWIGICTVPTALFVFTLQYTGRQRFVTRTTVSVFSAVPLITYLLVLTNGAHGWIWIEIASTGTATQYGPAFWGYTVYAQLLTLAATVLMLGFLYRSTGIYRGQAASLLCAIVAPWIGNISYHVASTAFDFTSLGFAITAVALGFAMVRYRFSDIVPVARNTVVDNITDGVFALDRHDRLVDVNQRGAALFGFDADSIVGRDARDVFPEPIVDRFGDAANGSDEVTVETADGDRRYLAVDVTPLGGDDRSIGRLFIVRDVTERSRRERELERRNEQLDRFASLVSHDLRNPLNVAQGYLQGVRSRTDDPELEEIDQSLDRMERIIEDVLTLTREGRPITEREPTDLADIARDAWRNVETRSAALTIDVDQTVHADRSRLIGAFENLFRNAVEHATPNNQPQAADDSAEVPTETAVQTERGATDHRGSEVDLHVRVGSLKVEAEDDLGPTSIGFYVEDDGPGIPGDQQESVLEAGYTTSDDGTGFGLDIVQTIVEAHGWTLSVTDGSEGGARFEVRYGLDAPDSSTDTGTE